MHVATWREALLKELAFQGQTEADLMSASGTLASYIDQPIDTPANFTLWSGSRTYFPVIGPPNYVSSAPRYPSNDSTQVKYES